MKKSKILFVGVTIALFLNGCQKHEPIYDASSTELSALSYFDLQNKYLDLALAYEEANGTNLRRSVPIRAKSLTLEEKIEQWHTLTDDEMEQDETVFRVAASDTMLNDEEVFYEQLYEQLMADVNAHPEVLRALRETGCKVSPMEMVFEWNSTPYSKMEIIKNAEQGIENIWNAEYESEDDEPMIAKGNQQKAARYTPHAKWGKVIKYRFDKHVKVDYKNDMRAAMATWAQAADNKIRFAELKNTCKNRFAWAIGVSYHIRIRQKNLNDAAGSSTLGCVPWATITLSDSDPDERTYLHELGHTLGLIHEHERYDRDKYVTIYWDNIKKGSKSQFYKKTKVIGACYGEFDYNSIMIYPSYAFSKNGNSTILKKDLTRIDKTTKLSAKDKWAIKEIYK